MGRSSPNSITRAELIACIGKGEICQDLTNMESICSSTRSEQLNSLYGEREEEILASSMKMPFTAIVLVFEFIRVSHDFLFPISLAVVASVFVFHFLRRTQRIVLLERQLAMQRVMR